MHTVPLLHAPASVFTITHHFSLFFSAAPPALHGRTTSLIPTCLDLQYFHSLPRPLHSLVSVTDGPADSDIFSDPR